MQICRVISITYSTTISLCFASMSCLSLAICIHCTDCTAMLGMLVFRVCRGLWRIWPVATCCHCHPWELITLAACCLALSLMVLPANSEQSFPVARPVFAPLLSAGMASSMRCLLEQPELGSKDAAYCGGCADWLCLCQLLSVSWACKSSSCGSCWHALFHVHVANTSTPTSHSCHACQSSAFLTAF